MRVIGGRARGRKLLTPPGRSLRPTPAVVREALFDILGEEIVGSRFLDLYAGIGAVGLEALSRGAEQVVLVESDRRHLRLVRANLEGTGLARGARVLGFPALEAVSRLERRGARFDLVFADPPYGAAAQRVGLLERLARGTLLEPEARVILEHPAREAPAAAPQGLSTGQTRRYGDSALTFYEQEPPGVS